MKKVILASASPRRKALLKKAGIAFVVKPSHVSEESDIANPVKRAEALALRKAKATSMTVKDGYILAADTLVVLGNKILGKPRDPDDAYRMLYRLSGSTHRVITGVAVLDAATSRAIVRSETSSVKMKKLPLDRLLALSRRHLDKAGSYAIQEKNDPAAKLIKGNFDNVVGLPVRLALKMLNEISGKVIRTSKSRRS